MPPQIHIINPSKTFQSFPEPSLTDGRGATKVHEPPPPPIRDGKKKNNYRVKTGTTGINDISF